MTNLNLIDKPFIPKLSFELLFENLDKILVEGLDTEKKHIKLILNSIKHRKQLTEGIAKLSEPNN